MIEYRSTRATRSGPSLFSSQKARIILRLNQQLSQRRPVTLIVPCVRQRKIMSEPGTLPYYVYGLNAMTLAMGLRGYGLPTATPENALVFPSATGRNLGAGFFVLTMAFMGERKVLGVFITCWAWAGVADCKILLQHPEGQNRVKHLINTIVVLILGPMLIRS
nr:hypothetical protein CFP56_74306 [Quercus suber]